jgi:geranylgeranyl diphosphate synthase type II
MFRKSTELTLNLKSYLLKQNKLVDSALKKFLPKGNAIMPQGMRYSMLAGGKRIRPVFVLLAAELFGVKPEKVMPAACAMEYIHTYSLVHDDLPSMDNDDLRRGKPTNHKKFGEPAAILCGDALLTEAFDLITKSSAENKNIIKAVSILSVYSGYKGMIGGQAEDTIFAGKWGGKNKSFLSKKLKYIQMTKTSALLIASLKIGAVLAGADDKSLKALETYGINAGIAFQIADDLLDVYADKKLLGKKGSDRDNDKLTELSLFGKEQAEKNAALHVKKAKNALKIFGKKAEKLAALADYMTERKY